MCLGHLSVSCEFGQVGGAPPGHVRLATLPARSPVPGPGPGRAKCGPELPFGVLNLSHAVDAGAGMEWGVRPWAEKSSGRCRPSEGWDTLGGGGPEKALGFRVVPCWAPMAGPLYLCLAWSPGMGALGPQQAWEDRVADGCVLLRAGQQGVPGRGIWRLLPPFSIPSMHLLLPAATFVIECEFV